MTTYFSEAPDGHGEPCIWAKGEPFDMPVIRQRETGPAHWPDVVARMTGTTITTDDATVDPRLAQIRDALDAEERTHDGVRADKAIRPRGKQ